MILGVLIGTAYVILNYNVYINLAESGIEPLLAFRSPAYETGEMPLLHSAIYLYYKLIRIKRQL